MRLRASEAKETQALRELAEMRRVMRRQARENEALRNEVNTLNCTIAVSYLLPHRDATGVLVSKRRQYWSMLSWSTTLDGRLSSDQCPSRQNQPPCQCLSTGSILCASLQASCDGQQLPKNLLADVPGGVPLLLLDSAAPLAPFERIPGSCELLEKPDTPTGVMAVPILWL